MMCDSCGKREAKYRSLGGIELCHECAHDVGLVHYHKDEGIDTFPHEHKRESVPGGPAPL
jgi:ribosomal protein L37AE/L43A